MTPSKLIELIRSKMEQKYEEERLVLIHNLMSIMSTGLGLCGMSLSTAAEAK